jgi:Fe-S cluster assembly protein SufD
MATTKDEAKPFLDAFGQRWDLGGQPSWLVARREAAMQLFAQLGYPTRREEAWRFTNLRLLTTAPVLPAAKSDASVDAASILPDRLAGETHRVVFVNGRYAPALSEIGALQPGVWLGSIADALKTRPDLVEMAFRGDEGIAAQPFASLNTAFFTDGFFLVLDAGAVLETPVEIVHLGRVAEPGAFHLRNAIVTGRDSCATLIETATGSGAAWINSVTSIDIGVGANLRHVQVQDESTDAIHFGLSRVRLAAHARYDSFSLILGARLSRQDIQVAMAGEGANLSLNGAYLLRGDQEATFAPFVDHQAPGGRTSEIVKAVVDDDAHGVFIGTIAVRPGADQTDARQLNRNLVLGPRAAIDTKPALEILADEVKCSHGATVGDLDEAALFYLNARGIDEATARAMLIEAFAADAIDAAELGPALGAHLRGYLRNWLEQKGLAA